MYSYKGKSVQNDPLGSSSDPCYIQNNAIMNHVLIKQVEVYFEFYRHKMTIF